LSAIAIVLLGVVALYAVVATFKAVSLPATEWDSLAYGVNYAKIIFEKGRIPLIAGPSIGLEMSASYPPGVQLIAVQLYEFAGSVNDFYFRILSPIFGLATMLATYKFAIIARKDTTFAIFAVFILGSIPFFWELFIQETYMMGLALMATLAGFFFYKAYISNGAWTREYEILGILFCSFAALTSYIGVFAFGLLLIYAVCARISPKRFGLLGIIALVITIPWFARNLLFLGNPLYPFFGIGKYLDPILRNSTVQHFKKYALIPTFNWVSTLSKLGIAILLPAVGYFTFSKRKSFLVIPALYFLLVSFTMMVLHLPFPRYLIIALPCSAAILSLAIKWLLSLRNPARFVAVPLVALFVISSVVVLPYMNSTKSPAEIGEDEWGYLSRVFEEGDAWNWINENTPENARIATYDIKEYYLNRSVLALDGNESAPLYKMSTIEECISFLQTKHVTYFLSVPWTSPNDTRLPAAYEKCPLTRHLGDARYLPPVYVGSKGSTVYHVGAIDAAEWFKERGFVCPTNHIDATLNTTSPYSWLHLPIPVDYRNNYGNGKMVFSLTGCDNATVELWYGEVPKVNITSSVKELQEMGYENMSIWQGYNSEADAALEWLVGRAGYFTLRVRNNGLPVENSSLTLDLKFHYYWET
jgi:hypothetical protein